MSLFGSARYRPLLIVVFLLTIGLIAGGLSRPVEVRHSAPFGFSQTLDPTRLIAVRGGYVVPNYDDFNRIDLDLRAYSGQEGYDLTVHVRPAEPGASDVRTIPLAASAQKIWFQKETLENPFITIRFPPIEESAGRRYYVWVEAGPRNRDAIWTLWSIKSYSRATGYTVLQAWLDGPPEPLGDEPGRVALILLIVGTVTATAWLVAALLVLPLGVSRRAKRQTLKGR
jgi:hypothetical protein